MTSQQILQTDLLDILFEHRNKDYGAYQLRKTYSQQLIKAVAISISAALLLLLVFKPSSGHNEIVANDNEVIVRTVKLPETEVKKPDLPKPPETPKTQVRQEIFTNQLEMKENVEKPLPPVDQLEKAVISDVKTEGSDVTTIQPPALPQTNGTEATNTPTKPEPEKEIVPDRQPQFPGGSQAWVAFLSNNLRAPEDLESGEKRTVLIRFHVAEDGSITNFEVIRSAGNAFDNEVIRVLKKMPKWAPAMKAGQPLSVSFTQPVTFVGVEQ